MYIDISKNFFVERCVGSAFELLYISEFHCNPMSCDWIPSCPSSTHSFTFLHFSAMNKENYSDLPSKAFSRGLQFRNTVQVLNLWYYECTNPLQVL